MAESGPTYRGVLFIGDPHLEGRAPGFRKDDYPRVILDKLAWCLEYAEQEQLLPAILGDLFDKPRDNPNWIIDRLLRILPGEVLGLWGNHDVSSSNELTPDDSLSLLISAGKIRLLSAERPWRGDIGGRSVVIGGSSYRQEIPKSWNEPEREGGSRPLVIWLTHHDWMIPGYDEGRLKPRAIPGVDYVINGHIHRKLADVQQRSTIWLTPGNISRRARSDATRLHVPAALRLNLDSASQSFEDVRIPHQPFDEVFHEAVLDQPPAAAGASAFVAGLAELQSRRTASGAGLHEFLQKNVPQFAPAVATEILRLASEIEHEQSP